MATKVTQSVQQVLARKLPGLKATELKSIAEAIAKVQAKGLKVDDVFPEGIVINDGVTIGGNLDPKELLNIGAIIAAAGSVKGVQVFPRGIPATPDMIRVKLTLHR